MTRKIILATGGFDPVHDGHINYLQSARDLGDMLIVGLNSNDWLERKKGYAFQTEMTRMIVISNLQMVDDVLLMDDTDGTAIRFIEECLERYGPDNEYWFVNGGDRTAKNIPENVPEFKGKVRFKFGVGGNKKINSSSDLVYNANRHIL